jgi:thiol-disulfide isomerase/thioredoxin
VHLYTFYIPIKAPNQIFTDSLSMPLSSVRNSDTFHTYQLLSSSSRTPLVTLWTTSWCSTCRVVEPLLQSIIEAGVGEAEGGVGYCTVEYDAPDIIAAGMGLTYMINSVPTLLSFDAQEAQIQTKIRDGRLLSDRKFLEEWIRTEARRHGDRGGGAGGGTHSGFFGGLLKS